MESRSSFSKPISQLRALLIEKKSGLEVRRAVLRACRWWYPPREKHTHLFFYIICQPFNMNRQPWAHSPPLSWQRAAQPRGEGRDVWGERGGQVERERGRESKTLSMCEVWAVDLPFGDNAVFPQTFTVSRKASQADNCISVRPSVCLLQIIYIWFHIVSLQLKHTVRFIYRDIFIQIKQCYHVSLHRARRHVAGILFSCFD